MTRSRSKAGNRQSGSNTARRRAAGAVSAVGAFLAFGLTPLATPATAWVDFDFLDLIDPTLGIGQAGGADALLGGFVNDLSMLDPSLTSEMSSINNWLEANWINTSLGEWVDGQLNSAAQALGSAPLIGNGTNGVSGGDGADGGNGTGTGSHGGLGGSADITGAKTSGSYGGNGGTASGTATGGAGGNATGSGSVGGAGGQGNVQAGLSTVGASGSQSANDSHATGGNGGSGGSGNTGGAGGEADILAQTDQHLDNQTVTGSAGADNP